MSQPQIERVAILMDVFSNAWYRIRHEMVTDSETGKSAIKFKHPVAQGSDDSGWMKPNPDDAQEDNKTDGDQRVLSLEEIAKHNNKVRSMLCFQEMILTRDLG